MGRRTFGHATAYLAIGIALMLAAPASGDAPPGSNDHRAATRAPVQPASCDLCAALDRLSESISDGPTSAVDIEATRRENEDLAAQQSMAASARLMLAPTRAQVWVGLIGLAGLIGSLGLGLLALAQTRAALNEQHRAAELELRAYLGLHQVTLGDVEAGAEPDVTIIVKNYGATPAYKVREKVNFILVRHGTPLPFDRTSIDSNVTINPGAESKTFSGADGYRLTKADMAALEVGQEPGGATLLVTGLVTYETFNTRRTLEFAVEYFGSAASDNLLVPEHNWAD